MVFAGTVHWFFESEADGSFGKPSLLDTSPTATAIARRYLEFNLSLTLHRFGRGSPIITDAPSWETAHTSLGSRGWSVAEIGSQAPAGTTCSRGCDNDINALLCIPQSTPGARVLQVHLHTNTSVAICSLTDYVLRPYGPVINHQSTKRGTKSFQTCLTASSYHFGQRHVRDSTLRLVEQ
jgi:hypothetical protein